MENNNKLTICWKPQENFTMSLSDETGEKRDNDTLQAMVDEIRRVSNKYGFDVSTYGGWDSLKKMALLSADSDILEVFVDGEGWTVICFSEPWYNLSRNGNETDIKGLEIGTKYRFTSDRSQEFVVK